MLRRLPNFEAQQRAQGKFLAGDLSSSLAVFQSDKVLRRGGCERFCQLAQTLLGSCQRVSCSGLGVCRELRANFGATVRQFA